MNQFKYFVIASLLFLSLIQTLNAQTINKAEWFFDTDPGVGNGMNIPIATTGDTVSIVNYSIPTNGLTNGFHNLFVRVRYDNGKWSVAETRPLYLAVTPNGNTLITTINRAEYFFDTDPGVGNGQPLSIPTVADSVSWVNNAVTVTNLSLGFHNLYVRVRDGSGKWSVAETRPFYLSTPNSTLIPTEITQAEYFINTDPGVGNGFPLALSSITDTVSLINKVITLTSDTCWGLGEYRLYIRVKDKSGKWSVTDVQTFNIGRVDAAIENIELADKTKCQLTANETVIVKVKNTGKYAIGAGQIKANLSVSGVNTGTYPAATHSDSIPKDSIGIIRILGVNLSNSGGNNIMTSTLTLCNDSISGNNTKTFTIASEVFITYYQDLDNDGFGNPAVTQYLNSCLGQPSGYVKVAGDCNDNNAAINPAMEEICGNNIDEDCNGMDGTTLCNDACAGAEILIVSLNETCTTEKTGRVYDAKGLGVVPTICDSVRQNYADVWYYFTANAAKHRIRLEKLSNVSGGQIFIQLYKGNGCDAKVLVAQSSCSSNRNIADLIYNQFEVNSKYYVQVVSQKYAQQDENPDFKICITTIESCALATAVAVPNNCNSAITDRYNFDLKKALPSSIPSLCQPNAKDLWYTFTPKNKQYSLVFENFAPSTTANSKFYIELLSGNCNNLQSVQCTENNSQIFKNLTKGTPYFFRFISTTNNDTAADFRGSFYLQPQLHLDANFGADTTLCPYDSLKLIVSGAETYLWSNNATTSSITVKPNGTFPFWVVGTDNGCIDKKTVQVNIQDSAYIIPSRPIITVCNGNSITVRANKAETAQWSNGFSGLTQTFIPTKADSILYLVATKRYCVYHDTVRIRVSDTITDRPNHLLPDSLSLAQDMDLFFEWSPVLGATGYEIYVWKKGEGKPELPTIINIRSNRVFYTIQNPAYDSTYYWQVSVMGRYCDNISDTTQFKMRNLPDLEVSNIQVPNKIISGEELTISYTVKNNGPGYTGFNKSWFDNIYFSDDTILQPTIDVPFGSVYNLSALQVGETYTQSATFRIPIQPVFSGKFYIIIEAGWTKRFAQVLKFPQVNYDNDIHVSANQITVVLPDESDLQVVAGTAPVTFFSNSKINVSWQVKNLGKAKTNKPNWRDGVVLVRDTVTMAGAFGLGFVGQESFLYKDSVYNQKILSNKIPADYSGRYYVIINADENNDVWEFINENNNRKVIPVDIILAPAPDLIPLSLLLPDTIYYGIPFNATLGVRNQGVSPSENVTIHKLTLTRDSLVVSKIPFYFDQKFLNAGNNIKITTECNVPMNSRQPIPYGTYKPSVKVDDTNAIFENMGENNNDSTFEKKVVLSPPDLTVSNIQTNIQSLVAGEQKLVVTYDIQNIGKPFLKNKWTDFVYLTSTNDPNAPIHFSEYPINGTTKVYIEGGKYKHEITFIFPCSFIPGKYFIWVKTDVENDVLESNENNNQSISSASIEIARGDCAVDLLVYNLSAPKKINYCNQYEVSYTIRNSGARPFIYGDDKSCNIGEEPKAYDIIGLYSDSSTKLEKRVAVLKKYDHCAPSKLDTVSYKFNTITQKVDTILPNDTLRVTTYFRLDSDYPTTPMEYFLMVRVNVGQYPLEISENNNFIGTRMVIDPLMKPDLKIELHDIPIEIIAGQPFKVIVKNYNSGIGGTIGSRVWANSIDLSYEPNNFSYNQEEEICQKSYLCESQKCNCRVLKQISLDTLVGGDKDGSCNFTQPREERSCKIDTITLTIPASTPTGTYFLIATTDIKNQICEFEGEDNNQISYEIRVTQPAPADLIVTSIDHPDSVDVGKPFKIFWKVKNINDTSYVKGYMRDAVYLSKDQTWSEEDILMGYNIKTIDLGPLAERRDSMAVTVFKAALEGYYVIVRTDILDNIWETNNLNNQAGSGKQMYIRIPHLPIGPIISDTLRDNEPLLYVIDTKPEHVGQTIIVELTTPDSIVATNQLYIKNGILPSLDDFDSRSLRSAFGNQEAPIPLVAQNGHYYLYIEGRKSVKDSQLVKLRAYVLPFTFRTVQAAKGGNTGFATVLLTGGRFDPNMTLFLEKDTVKIPVDSMGFVDGTKAYVRFNLKDKPIGQYILRGQHPQGDTAAYRYYDVVAGGEQKLVTYLRHPQSVASRGPATNGQLLKLFLTLEFENQGTNDIPIPAQPVRSVAGAPIALTSTGLATSTATELLVPMRELEGPQTYLRAGARGSILIWVNFSDKAMVYLMDNGDN